MRVSHLVRPVVLGVAALLALATAPPPAAAGETLGEVRRRGTLRCGVSEGVAGLSAPDASGRWSGLDADFCRAVAAAALGDAGKVSFVPLRASERFPALTLRTIDLLARTATWTLAREAGLGVHFVGVLLYDGQGFLVPAESRVTSVAGLDGASVCLVKGTTHERTLPDHAASRGLRITPLVIDSTTGAVDAFLAGRCAAYTADASQLAVARLRAPAGRSFRILPERISKEPLSPVVRRGDDDWLALVRWVLFALVAAEERGITGEQAARRAPAARAALGTGPEALAALGVDADWALRAVGSVGNYGEMFDRNLGARSPLGLERGLNRLWTHGGLMYAPPLR